MGPNLLTSFYAEGYLYLVYVTGEIVRRLVTQNGFGWERVEGPRVKNGKLDVIEKREQRMKP